MLSVLWLVRCIDSGLTSLQHEFEPAWAGFQTALTGLCEMHDISHRGGLVHAVAGASAGATLREVVLSKVSSKS